MSRIESFISELLESLAETIIFWKRWLSYELNQINSQKMLSQIN